MFNFTRGDSMANRRPTFAKRHREADLKEKARAKLARRLAKRSEVRTSKGPEIVGLEAAHAIVFGGDVPAATAAPASPAIASDDDPTDPTPTE